MSDTLVRHWHMLRMLPRAPRKIAAPQIQAGLSARGITVTARSVQRDLNKLSGFFPILCDDAHKPYGWSWARDAAPFDLPGMDLHTALAYRLASEHLKGLLPHATRAYLTPRFEAAVQLLDRLEATGLGRWVDRVRVIHRHQPLQPPRLDPAVFDRVQEAVLEGRRLAIRYRRRGEEALNDYEINPLALVFRDSVPYVLCTFWHYQDVRQLAVHRMAQADVLERPQAPAEGFDLDGYIAGGGFGFQVGSTPLALALRVEPGAGAILTETPLSPDQRVTPEPEPPGWLRVTATVPNTRQLRVWLRGFGALVEVLGPPNLRQEMLAEARATAALYGA